MNRTTFSDDVSQQLFALTDGGVSNIIEIDGGYYIFYCSSAFDAELTEAHNMYGMDPSMFGGNETLILNVNNKLVQYILDHKNGVLLRRG